MEVLENRYCSTNLENLEKSHNGQREKDGNQKVLRKTVQDFKTFVKALENREFLKKIDLKKLD